MTRFFGILFSPRATYARVNADPAWFGILAMSLGVIAIISTIFLSTDIGQRALLAQQVEGMERFGMTVTDEAYAQMEQAADLAVYFALANLVVGIPIVCLVIAGVLYIAAYGFLGARGTFKHFLAVVTHAGVVFVVQQAFVAPLNYARESMTNPATLAAFVPTLDPTSFLVQLLSMFDVFVLWWVMLLAIGISVVCERRTAPIAVTLYSTYVGVGGVIAIILTRLAG